MFLCACANMVGKIKLLVVALILLVVLSVYSGLHRSLLPAAKYSKGGMSRIHELEQPAANGINGNVHRHTQSLRHSMSQPVYTEQSTDRHHNPALFNNDDSDMLINYHCNNDLCTEYLNPTELKQFWDCTKHRRSGHNNGTCRFINGASRHTVALASFPGSGSTWVRGLLEKATDICTGSVYCDTSLRSVGFNGEGLSSPAVLVVKTHESVKLFEAAIHLVRCPADTLVSEWNRKHGGVTDKGSKHMAVAPPESFGSNKEWGEFVVEWSRRWSHAALRLAAYQTNHPLLRVFYDDVKSHPTREVLRILDFLRVPYSQSLVELRLRDGFGEFHRAASKESFKHFTAEQRQELVTALSHVIRESTAKGYEDTKQYVQNYLSCL